MCVCVECMYINACVCAPVCLHECLYMCVCLCVSVCVYLAFGGSHFGKHGLGNLGSPHLLLDLLIDGAADMEHRAGALQLHPHRRHPGLQGERGGVTLCPL